MGTEPNSDEPVEVGELHATTMSSGQLLGAMGCWGGWRDARRLAGPLLVTLDPTGHLS